MLFRSELPLLLSDFLTIDDGNKKLLSQVVSIESTNTESTNCAILKFSLDINENNTYAVYSGYTPALDAKIEKTPTNIIDSVFSSAYKTILIGNLTGSTQAEINLNASVIDKFLYLQSDRIEDTQKFISKLVEFNNDNGLKTLLIDLDGIAEYSNTNVIELGKEFKLPIGNETLNYIYEYDLTGLTLEQKTIVQDIILEIQEYINTLESGFIPFNTLLEVVNDIYDSDKSTGGLSRVDFFLTKDTNEVVFNEINTLPGFTAISMYPMLWEARGLSKKALVQKLIDLAMNRYDV